MDASQKQGGITPVDIMGQAETDSAQPTAEIPGYQPADAEEVLMQGIMPASIDNQMAYLPKPPNEISVPADDDPNSVPVTPANVTDVTNAIEDAVAKVTASADQLNEAVQKISATADQMQVVQDAQTEPAAMESTAETPVPLTEEAINAIVDKKVEEAITASTATPAEPEKEQAPTATPITVETLQAIGTAVVAAITAVSTETPTVQAENSESAMPTEIPAAKISPNKFALEPLPTSNGNGHAVKQLSKTNLFLTTVIVVLSISFGFYGLYQGNHPQSPSPVKPEPAQITPMGPVALPFISDTPEESPDDYNLIIQKQVNLLKARPVKLKLGKILAESETVAQTIQNNIDQLKRKGSTDAQAVIKSFLFENVVDAILGELPEDQKSTEGIRDMIKAELEKVSKYAEANFPEKP